MSLDPPPKIQPDPAPSPAPPKNSGWLDNLALRSTGLPPPDAPPPPPNKDEKSPWSYAGIGLQFAATTAIFTAFGLFLDSRFHSAPWWTLALTLLGLVGGMYLLIKQALQANAEPPRNAAKKSPKDGPP